MATIDNIPLQQGQQPTHVQSGDGDAFVLGSTLLADNPFLKNTYFKQSGRDMTTLEKIDIFFPGRLNTDASWSPKTGHYEKPRWNKNITIGSISAGSNADEAVITLSTADMVTDAVAQSGITYVRSYPRKRGTIQGVPGGLHYWIIDKDETVNPHTITVKSPNGADPMDELVDGMKVTVGPPTKAEGTDTVDPLTVRRYKYENTFVIIEDKDAVSGTHMTTKVRFQPVPGSNLLFLEGLQDMEKRHQYGKGYKWLFDDQVATPGAWQEYSPILGANAAISGTQGLLAYTIQSGRRFQYDPNDFSLQDLRALSNYYHDINVPSDTVLLIQGYAVNQLIEEAWEGKLTYEWVVGVSDKFVSQQMRNNWAKSLGGNYDPHGAFLNLGISGFTIGQRTYMQTAAPEFNDANGPGALGYNYWMIGVPFDYADVEGDKIPYLGYEYRGAEGYRRVDELVTVTGAGTRRITGRSDFYKTSTLDGAQFLIRSEIAAHFALGEQFALFTPDGSSS